MAAKDAEILKKKSAIKSGTSSLTSRTQSSTARRTIEQTDHVFLDDPSAWDPEGSSDREGQSWEEMAEAVTGVKDSATNPKKRQKLNTEDQFGTAILQILGNMSKSSPAAPAPAAASSSNEHDKLLSTAKVLQDSISQITKSIQETTDDEEKAYLRNQRDVLNARLEAVLDKL